METIGLRLKKYLEYKDVSRNLFCDAIGMKYNSLSRIINGSAAMNSDTLNKIFTYFPDLNARWLMTGNGPMDYGRDSYYLDQELENGLEGKRPIKDECEKYDTKPAEKSIDEILMTFIDKEDVRAKFINILKSELDKKPENDDK